MKERIINLYKKIKYLNYKINPSILASSISFYIIITIIPILMLLYSILYKLNLIDIKIDYLPNNFTNIIIFMCSLIWSSSKLINNLMLVSDEIYYYKEARSKIKLRIFALIATTVLIMIIIAMICIILYISYIKSIINIKYIILYELLEYMCMLVFISILIGIIYKYIIPIKISIMDTLKSSIIITIILFLMTNIYQNVLWEIILVKYANIYGSFASIILTFIWLYYNSYIFIIGIGILIFKKMYNNL